MTQTRRTHRPLARQFITVLAHSALLAPPLIPRPPLLLLVVRLVAPTDARRLQPGLHYGFEHLTPKRSVRIDRSHSNLARCRCVFLSYPRNLKRFSVVQACERNVVAWLEHSVDAVQQRPTSTDIHRHHSLIQRTAADVGPRESHLQRQINSRVATLAQPLRTQVAQKLLRRQGRP